MIRFALWRLRRREVAAHEAWKLVREQKRSARTCALAKARYVKARDARRYREGHPDPRFTAAKGCSEDLVHFIMDFEGGQSSDGRFRPYYDANGNVWTQGYGHTENVRPSSRSWSAQKAARVLRRDMDRKYVPYVTRLGIAFRQRELDALASAVYNLGGGVLDRGRTLGDTVRDPKTRRSAPAIYRAFEVYDHDANGKVLDGLRRRRHAEARLYLTGSYSTS